MLVGRGNLNEGHVNGNGSSTEEFRDVAKIDGSVIGSAFRNGFPAPGGDKERLEAAFVEKAGFRVPGPAYTEDLKDFKVGQVGNDRLKGSDQVLRFAAPGTYEYAMAPLEDSKGLLRSCLFLLEDSEP